jgi:hypothetical protein
MFSPILMILAKYGYLPKDYNFYLIHAQIEKLIFDAIENNTLIPAIKSINKLLRLDINKINSELEESPGFYCPILRTNLECKCNMKHCKNWNLNFTWNCNKLGDSYEEVSDVSVDLGLQEFNAYVNLLEDTLETNFEYPKNTGLCIKCGKEGMVPLGKFHVMCKGCFTGMNSIGLQSLLLEVRFGRSIREIINYVLRLWDTIQQQARVLGIKPENLQILCSNYNINMKRYRQIGDSRFINPFLNRKKGKPLIDSYILRLYSLQIKLKMPIRKEISKLEEFLLSEANLLLQLRDFELFDIPTF